MMVVLQYGTPHEPIHHLAGKYVFASCMFSFHLFQLRVFTQIRMNNMDRDQPLHLRPTRRSGSRDK